MTDTYLGKVAEAEGIQPINVARNSNPTSGRGMMTICGTHTWSALPDGECVARLHPLAALVRLVGGWRWRPLAEHCRAAKTDPQILAIDVEFDRMPHPICK
jgi:hypothetical protein